MGLLEELDVGVHPTLINFGVGLQPYSSDFASPFYDCPIQIDVCGKSAVSLRYFICLLLSGF